jgi:hypothetical protein
MDVLFEVFASFGHGIVHKGVHLLARTGESYMKRAVISAQTHQNNFVPHIHSSVRSGKTGTRWIDQGTVATGGWAGHSLNAAMSECCWYHKKIFRE